MARPIVVQQLQPYSEANFYHLLRQVIYSLHIRTTSGQLDVEVVEKISTRYLAAYFVSPQEYQQFLSNLAVMKHTFSELFEFLRGFYDKFRIQLFAPYNEAQWDECYVDIVHGAKRQLVTLRHLASQITMPEIAIPENDMTPRLQHCLEEVQNFENNLNRHLQQIEDFLDEDYLETWLQTQSAE